MNAEQGGSARQPSPYVATLLSFLWPGLGQWYLGRTRLAALYGVPVLIVVLILVVQAFAGLEQFALALLVPSAALTMLILVALLALWRILSMGDALTVAQARSSRKVQRPRLLFGGLALLVALSHFAVARSAWSFYEAGSRIFAADGTPDASPPPSGPLASGSSGPIDIPLATPVSTPSDENARVNILLAGIDSAPGRSHALTDSLIVVSVDPTTKTVAMVSFPRDIGTIPMWDGRTYHGKINSLMSYAATHPESYPDGAMNTLVKELGYLIGVPIHYYASVNLPGFEQMVNAVGGVDIEIDKPINDPSYGGWNDGRVGFRITAGRHHLDGASALAFVRSRKGQGDNDFTRARRQQQLLLALEHKFSDPAMIGKIDPILKATSDTIRTNFPAEQLADMLELGRGIDETSIKQFVLGPPYSRLGPMTSVYELRLDLDRVARLSVELFGSESRYATSVGMP